MDERILGLGGSSIISLYDEATVLKGYVVWLDGRVHKSFEKWDQPRRALDREREIYERLGSHSNILKYLGTVEVEPGVFSLRLERAPCSDLRSFIRANGRDVVSMCQRHTWIIGIASALAHVHSKGVYQCDLSCRNILVISLDLVKLGDFGGSKIDDKNPYDCEEAGYELPLRGRLWEERPYSKREIFALGSAIYEIMTWQKPFGDQSPDEVEKRYAREEFPDLKDVPKADIIQKCWQEAFSTVGDVLFALSRWEGIASSEGYGQRAKS